MALFMTPSILLPACARITPEVPENIQNNLANLELADTSTGRASAQSHNQNPSTLPTQQPTSPPKEQQRQPTQNRTSYTSYHYNRDQAPKLELPKFGDTPDMPNFSPFPPINAKPNVPPSDEEKEQILENARIPVLNSNDPEMQLAWAQDVLAYVATSQLYEERLAQTQARRPSTPQIEHQLRVDAMNIVNFLAEQHHPKAEFMKGMWLEFGNFAVRQDKREAFRSYARAAEGGYHRAEYRMGMQFEQNGDPVKALIHYQRGAEAGDAASNYVRTI
jgi:TPR repeat protein